MIDGHFEKGRWVEDEIQNEFRFKFMDEVKPGYRYDPIITNDDVVTRFFKWCKLWVGKKK